MTKEKKINSRSWQLIIPLDFPIEEIKTKVKLICRNYYFVMHDKDIDDFGEPKKPHWHLLFTFSNSRDLTTVKNYFTEFPMLLDNSFEKISSVFGAKKYLCHFDHPNKAQYNPSDVETNDELFKDLFLPPMSKIDEMAHIKRCFSKTHLLPFGEFVDQFAVQFATMSTHQRINTYMRLFEFYKSVRLQYKFDTNPIWDVNHDDYVPSSSDYLENLPF